MILNNLYVFKRPFAIAPPLSTLNTQSTNPHLLNKIALLSATIEQPFLMFIREKHTIDRSRVPVINEKDIEEKSIRGNGPGGSNVNTNSNCIVIKHIPSGIVVKCHLSRLLSENRKLARTILIQRLDEKYNGDMSVKAQEERILQKLSQSRELKNKKLSEMKENYKKLISSPPTETTPE